jgi:hypothetical protein
VAIGLVFLAVVAWMVTILTLLIALAGRRRRKDILRQPQSSKTPYRLG